MNSHAVGRFVELFFRRWPYYGLLGLLSLAMGLTTLQDIRSSFTAQGSVFVETTSLVARQSGIEARGARALISPSEFTKDEMFGLLFTSGFMAGVFERTDLELSDHPATREFQLDELRSTVDIKDQTNNLVLVEATTDDPALSQSIVQAVIDQFVEFQISVEVAAGTGSEGFFTELVVSRDQDLQQARDDIDELLAGKVVIEELTFLEENELVKLEAREAEANEAYQDAIDDLEASRLIILQAETNVRQRYSLYGPPLLPDTRDATGSDGYLRITSFVIIAVIVTLLGPLLAVLSARTVLFADDVAKELNLPVLAIVPQVDRKRLEIGQDQAMVPSGDGDSDSGPGAPGRAEEAEHAGTP